MHIAVVTETWPPQVNGVALTVHGAALGLRARGHRVEVIRPGPDCDATSVLPEMIGARKARLPHYAGLNIGLPHFLKLRKRWARERPDVAYVATEGPLGWSALRVAKAMDIPVATGFHTRFDEYTAHYGLRWLKPLMRAHMLRFHRRASATVAPTRALVAELKTAGIDNAELVRRSVDSTLFSPLRKDAALRSTWKARDHAPVVLYVGRMAAEKNIVLAIHAFRTLQARLPEARMVLVGEGPLQSALAAQNQDLVFTGALHGENLARHYASADMFLFPSLTDTFGNVVLEAMASGLSLVAFDVAAAAEHVVNGISGWVVPEHDSRGFVAGVFELGLNRDLRATLGLNARIAAQHLTPEKALADFETFLQRLYREQAHGQIVVAAHS